MIEHHLTSNLPKVKLEPAHSIRIQNDLGLLLSDKVVMDLTDTDLATLNIKSLKVFDLKIELLALKSVNLQNEIH